MKTVNMRNYENSVDVEHRVVAASCFGLGRQKHIVKPQGNTQHIHVCIVFALIARLTTRSAREKFKALSLCRKI